MDIDYNLIECERLSDDHILDNFDCGKNDLNEFLVQDPIPHLKELFAVTYVYTYKNQIIAFYSVSNDKIIKKEIDKSIINKLSRKIKNEKRKYKSFPAVKLVRFGIDKKFQKIGLGTNILNYIKMNFIDNNKTGCRFITVDAYNDPETLKFYENNRFSFLIEKNEDETQLMYFDLFKLFD